MIGIIGAMEEEVSEIKHLMTDVNEIEISNLTFYKGKLENKEVVLAKSGIGKTLSALTTTILVSNFDFDSIINVGTAGGIKEELNPLDVIVSNRVAQCDFDLTEFGYKQDFSEKRISFKTDHSLVNKLKALNLDNVIFGDIVSSDTFISNQQQVKNILNKFPSALCADMEAGSIAMTLDHFKVPFIVIRSISDVIGSDKGNALEFKQYLEIASKHSANITKQLIKSL